ncbi:hemicentin-1-like [Acropora muricata]|uniref:hemicentin-1-like n=1 Tax=Acropora muricata TaxID=159855 RepID=UPI0034E57C12
MRSRRCENPRPQFGGKPCTGSNATAIRGCTNKSTCTQDFPVRFLTVEGFPSNGSMEIFNNGTWKQLCIANWDNVEGLLVCQEQGYNGSTLRVDWQREQNGSGNTSHSCEQLTQSCEEKIDREIKCSVAVRLVGVKDIDYAGRVEVFYEGKWGKICRNEWDINDVKVVCRQLGFESALAEFIRMDTKDENVSIAMSNVACTGQEFVLASCKRLDRDHKCVDNIGAQALCGPKNRKIITMEKKHHVCDLGSTETVKCPNVEAGSGKSISWYDGSTGAKIKSGGRIEFDGLSLKINNVQLEDAGTYECRGVSSTGFLTIYVNANFIHENKKQKFISGKPGIIQCSAMGNPAPQFKWSRKDGRSIQGERFIQMTNGSLKVEKMQRNDTGSYTCTMKQSRGTESTSEKSQNINVRVIVPPEVTLLGPHHATEGRNVTLTCTITDGDPRPQLIRWLKDKAPVDVKDTSMTLSTIKKKDEGNYICETGNEGGSANGSINITVHIPPKLNPDLKDGSVSVYLNSLSRITCTESGDPEPNVTWTKNGNYFVNNNTFTINKVTVRDAGRYGCTAENRAGKINATLWIDVIDFPVVDVYPRNQTVLERRPTVITCTARGIPRPALSWTFNNGELPPNAAIRNFSEQSILQLSKTSKSMEGQYTCKAKNKAGEARSNSTLHVLEKPTVTMSSKPQLSLREGERLTLTCQANEATKKIRWTKDGVPVNKRANIYAVGDNSTLVIENVLTSDSGKYSCEAINKAGSTLSSVDITVTDKITVQWYVIVGLVLAVTVLASILLYLWKRRFAGT